MLHATHMLPPCHRGRLRRFWLREQDVGLGAFRSPRHKMDHATELERCGMETFWNADVGVCSMHDCECSAALLVCAALCGRLTCMHASACPGCVQSATSAKALTEAFVHATGVLRDPLSSHADPNEANRIGGGTAIQAAIANGDESCLRLLLAAGADPNGSARLQHFSALQHAAFLAASLRVLIACVCVHAEMRKTRCLMLDAMMLLLQTLTV